MAAGEWPVHPRGRVGGVPSACGSVGGVWAWTPRVRPRPSSGERPDAWCIPPSRLRPDRCRSRSSPPGRGARGVRHGSRRWLPRRRRPRVPATASTGKPGMSAGRRRRCGPTGTRCGRRALPGSVRLTDDVSATPGRGVPCWTSATGTSPATRCRTVSWRAPARTLGTGSGHRSGIQSRRRAQSCSQSRAVGCQSGVAEKKRTRCGGGCCPPWPPEGVVQPAPSALAGPAQAAGSSWRHRRCAGPNL
jgi:hypothetical protein